MRFGERLGRRRHPAKRPEGVAIRERRPGRREGRVELQRAPGVAETDLDRLRRRGEVGVAALEELEVRLGVHRVALGQLRRLLRRQLDRDLARDGLGELALQAEHVLELAVVAIGPERLVGRAPRSSCTLRRTRLPRSSAEPSSTASTFSSRAISGSESVVPLYCIADVREITRSARMRARSEMIASVMPSAKYSCAGSRETLRNGSTAIARIASLAGRADVTPGPPSRIRRRASPTSAAEAGRCAGSL